MDYPTVDQIEINAENKDSFGQMQNHVCLVAQLQLAGSTSGGVKEVFSKSAKFYYGFQQDGNNVKTMYNKNLPKTRLNTDDYNKKLTPIIPREEDSKLSIIKTKITEYFTNYIAPRGTVGDTRDSFNKDAYKNLDATFNELLISDPNLFGQGARVMLYARYTKTNDNVNAYGQMLFIKSGSVESLKLNIKNNTVTLGSIVGDKKSLISLMNELFGVKFTIAPKSADETGAEAEAEVNELLAIENSPLAPVALPATAPTGILSQEELDKKNKGGKSDSRKRQMSSKKGGRSNSASRKQNKKGGAKTRRSQKGGKRAR